MSSLPLSDLLRVGIIQTTTANEVAWASGVTMCAFEEERAILEIQQHMVSLSRETPTPDIVLLPELAIPIGFIARLRGMAARMNAIVIGGVDFEEVPGISPRKVRNRAAVIVPNRWQIGLSSYASVRYVGKTYPSYEEDKSLKAKGCEFMPTPEVWLFETERFGRFGVVICFDLLDLERVAMYRMQVHHLFVVAYNKDISTFDHVAEALSRMIYCNVVICNTGQYGGSIAVSPLKLAHKRTIYRHYGAGLSTSQTICLPVAKFHDALTDNWPLGKDREFKALPPGAKLAISHPVNREIVPKA